MIMRDAEPVDLQVLRPEGSWDRALHRRIVSRLGEQPARLPSIVQLRVERMAGPCAIASAAVLAIALLTSRFESDRLDRPITAPDQLITTAVQAERLGALDTYLFMRGIE
jgi:hypothetical protein